MKFCLVVNFLQNLWKWLERESNKKTKKKKNYKIRKVYLKELLTNLNERFISLTAVQFSCFWQRFRWKSLEHQPTTEQSSFYPGWNFYTCWCLSAKTSVMLKINCRLYAFWNHLTNKIFGLFNLLQMRFYKDFSL